MSSRVSRIVAFLHHLPFAELVPKNRPDKFAFAAGFMGSAKFGKLLSKYEKITNVYCGHSHWGGKRQIAQMDVVNVGSTYIKKHLKIFETGGCQ